MKEKVENESRWKTKHGFDVHMKKTNFNEHPKKPHPATMDDLLIPYMEQKNDEKSKLKGQQYRPQDHGKTDFQSKVQNVNTFSDQGYFKTVFASGDDM